MSNDKIAEIKSDIQTIINQNRPTCLCGHGEWCESCNPASHTNKMVRELNDYLNKLQ